MDDRRSGNGTPTDGSGPPPEPTRDGDDESGPATHRGRRARGERHDDAPASGVRADGGEDVDDSGASPEQRSDGDEGTDDSRASPEQRSDGDEGTDDSRASSDQRSDGGERPQAHTIRLELVDEPGELLRALEPIADHGGNLLSIFHERGSLTPRGRVPVEVDLECVPGRFDDIVAALRAGGVNVVQAGAERYSEEVTVVLVGHLIGTDLSDTISRIEGSASASVADLSLSAVDGTAETSSARLRLAAEAGTVRAALDAVRRVAEEKDLLVIEPLLEAEP